MHAWKAGKAIPDWESVERLAAIVGKEPLELLAKTRAGATALRHHPDFAESIKKAKARFPNRVPDSAYEQAGATHAAQWPEHIDEVFVFNLAQFWWTNATNQQLIDAEGDQVRAEMAEIDAKRSG